jgi:hypothetical protein
LIAAWAFCAPPMAKKPCPPPLEGPNPMHANDCWMALVHVPSPQDATSVGSHVCPALVPPLHVQAPKAGSCGLAVPK